MLKILLIRHGETEWNKTLRYQGHSDVPLSDLGREQARALSARLAREKIDAFYASDLSRAMETGSILAEPHNKKIITIPELRETKFGLWEGLTYKEIVAKYPAEMNAWRKKPTTNRIPGGETLIEVKERCEIGLNKIKTAHKEGTVLLVAHGGIIRVIIGTLLSLNLDDNWKLKQDNTALNVIEIYDDKAILCLLNDTNHLNNGICP